MLKTEGDLSAIREEDLLLHSPRRSAMDKPTSEPGYCACGVRLIKGQCPRPDDEHNKAVGRLKWLQLTQTSSDDSRQLGGVLDQLKQYGGTD
jgi:hypothetical protein